MAEERGLRIGSMKREKKRQIKNKRRFVSRNRHVVYVSGTFDILHVGHIHLFNEARKYGNYLVVSVNTDEYVSSYKFTPIVPFKNRLEMVSNLKIVNAVMPRSDLFDTEAYKKYGVGVRVKGKENNMSKNELAKTDEIELKKYGVKCVWIERIGNYSSSELKEKIKKS